MPARSLPCAVWVVDASIGGHARKQKPRPGLLLQRRFHPSGAAGWWEGLVVIARSGIGEDAWVLDMSWLPYSDLQPVMEDPPNAD